MRKGGRRHSINPKFHIYIEQILRQVLSKLLNDKIPVFTYTILSAAVSHIKCVFNGL